MTAQGIEFAQPYILLLLLLLPLLGTYYYKKQQEYYATLRLSSTQGFLEEDSWRVKLRPVIQVLQLLAITSLIVALARPRLVLTKENVEVEGIDIMISMDVSSSMLAKDFDPNRLEVSKAVAKEFVKARTHDRIGLIVFSGESFTQCPLTTDHQVLNIFLDNIQSGLLKPGTALGMGLATAVKGLEASKSKSKIVILLTDGENNSGYISPTQAIGVAQEFDIKVYTIGVGTKGQARMPSGIRPDGTYAYRWMPVNIDEDLLTNMAKETGGQYFRAKDLEELKAIYDKIDMLERSKIETTTIRNYSERFHYLVVAALIFIFLQLVLSNTIFKTIV
ncbi:MAG: vWA domain-containing protein [Aureispira sp.]